jgi:predicted Zn-dependent peptidase
MGILSTLMGGSMSSRLFKSIREEQGLAYSVGSRVEFFTDTGLFIVSAGVSNKKVEQTIKAIQGEIEKLKDFSFTETEFLKAKNLYKSESIFDFEEMHHRMVEIGTAVLLDGKEETIEDMIKKIDAVTYEDVKAVQGLITDMSKYTWFVYSDREYFIDRILAD